MHDDAHECKFQHEHGGTEVVCLLKHTLYGMRQAPRAWHQRLKEDLNKLGFEASEADPAFFSGIMEGERVYLVVWVDDILIAAPGAKRAAKVKAHLAEAFTCAIWGRRRTSSRWS